VTEPGARAGDPNQIEGTILASAYGGGSIEYEVAALGKILKARIANPKGKLLFQRGDRILLAFAPEDLTMIPINPSA
jgi:hypothetical protein